MKRFVVAASMALAALAAPGAAGQAPTQDSVTGTALACRQPPGGCLSLPPGQFGTWVRLTADARSGPSGESPAGTMTWDERFVGGFSHAATEVSCLSVTDKVAIVGVSGTRRITFTFGTFEVPIAGLIRITDGGTPPSGFDTVEFGVEQGPIGPPPPPPPLPGPTDCSTFPAGVPVDAADDGGDLVVTDVQPFPTSKDQCKNGGWRNFPDFKNQGQCIRFVRHQARQKCVFERAATGITGFRAKYGLGPNHDHAMRHCVRLYTGF
jgi:hypothetical protein